VFKSSHITNLLPKKGSPRAIDPDDLIKAAIQDGLSKDKSDIDSKPVYKELAPITKPQYARMMRVWFASVASTADSHSRT
jgi:hypothetical protein